MPILLYAVLEYYLRECDSSLSDIFAMRTQNLYFQSHDQYGSHGFGFVAFPYYRIHPGHLVCVYVCFYVVPIQQKIRSRFDSLTHHSKAGHNMVACRLAHWIRISIIHVLSESSKPLLPWSSYKNCCRYCFSFLLLAIIGCWQLIYWNCSILFYWNLRNLMKSYVVFVEFSRWKWAPARQDKNTILRTMKGKMINNPIR